MTPLSGTEHHPHAAAVLTAALPPEGAASHAYLFHGPAGTGKARVAREFAAELLAEGSPDPDNARRRALLDPSPHPDLTWVKPSGAHELLVGDVDQVVKGATRTPFEARRRVFVIESADTMNDTAANKLLKTLEEPASFVHLILLTGRPGEVLPTVRSRCQAVRFDPLPAETIAARLGGIDALTAEACARLALGDGGRARRLAFESGPTLRAAAEAYATAALDGVMATKPWTQLLAAAGSSSEAVHNELDALFEAELETTPSKERKRVQTDQEKIRKRAQRRAERETLDLGLSLVGLWFRDSAAIAWGAADSVHAVDRRDALEASAAKSDAPRLRRAVELVDDTRQRFPLNVSEELACEALAYRLERLLAG